MDKNVILVRKEHSQKLGASLARAFRDDPGCRYIFKDADSCERHMRWIFSRWVWLMAHRNASYTVPELCGASLWSPPETGFQASMVDQIRAGFLWALFRLTPAQQYRGLKVHQDAVARTLRHISSPHWVLDTLGVAPEYQGEGIASALVNAALEKADAAEIPCYVITHKPANVPFYERFGFNVVESSPLPGTELIVNSLLRPVPSS